MKPIVLLAVGRFGLLAFGLMLVGKTSAHASVLDWSSVTWSPDGALSQTYNNVDSSGLNISFNFPAEVPPAFAGTAVFPSGISGPDEDNFVSSTPRIDDANGDSLRMRVNFGDENSTGENEYIALQIDFDQSLNLKAKNVSFSIFDIDTSSGNETQDLVVVVGVTQDGTLVAPTSLTPTSPVNGRVVDNLGLLENSLYEAPNNPALIQNSGVVGLQNNGTTNGAATWDFGEQQLVGLILVYTNGKDAARGGSGPGNQSIFLGDINFTVVPEAETYWTGGLLLLLGVGWELRRRRRWSL